jgi:high-affinity nickel-transport protein
VIELVGSSVFVAALLFGFRHGFDWDHLAALTDLTGSQPTARRSMRLATLYALGHGAMVVALGTVAILFAERLPASVDLAMERAVGVTLISLGLWMAWTAVRTRGAPPLRSRWMILIAALRRLILRVRGGGTPVVIEHSHPHDHHALHEHSHGHLAIDAVHPSPAAPTAPVAVAVGHTHAHRHVAIAPADPFVTYGGWSSFGVGVIHGFGAETPTQLLVFSAAMQSSGRPTSIGLLLCFVVGLIAANTMVAAGSTFGFRRFLHHRVVAGVLAGVTAAFSLVVGSLLLLGHSAALPAIFAG